jgi:hypothetical protein
VGKEGHASGVGKEDKTQEISRFGEFAEFIYYNCGTPGHHKASCKKPLISSSVEKRIMWLINALSGSMVILVPSTLAVRLVVWDSITLRFLKQ